MNLLILIITGLIIGVIAKFLMPGRDPGGFIMTILLGIGGMFLGNFIGQAAGFHRSGQAMGWIISVFGAIVLLVIYRVALSRGHTSSL